MRTQRAIGLCVGLLIAGAACGQTANADTAATPRLDLTDTTVEVQLWPPKLRAYGLVWVPNATASDRTGVGLGLETVLPYTLKGDRESLTSELGLSFLGTTKNQWRFALHTDLHWNQNRNYARFRVGYDDLAREFWGIGPATEESAQEIYRPNDFVTFVETTWRLLRALAVGPRIEYQHHAVHAADEGGQLDSGGVLGVTGGGVLGFGAAIDWDRRDDRYRPSEGWYIRSRFMRFRGAGSYDAIFSVASLDWRTYRRLGENLIYAGQFYVEGVTDRTPFWRMPSLGGEAYSRAYPRDRWLDDTLMAGQAEWRWQALRRWSLVGFAGAAVVADDLASLQFKYLRPSFGAGIRYFADKGEDLVPIRLDFAVGYESWRISLGIAEAF